MRGRSHQSLGRYLAEKYMAHLPQRYVQAFLIGCIEPDRNPATYLKGSLSQQWLRGHNWGNAEGYMQKVSCRLENRCQLGLLDYYALGKLIHYTMDAFTSPHNAHFGEDLLDHRQYEVRLQHHFLQYLAQDPAIWTNADQPMMETIRSYHREYVLRPVNIHTDTRYAIIVCNMLLARLFAAA